MKIEQSQGELIVVLQPSKKSIIVATLGNNTGYEFAILAFNELIQGYYKQCIPKTSIMSLIYLITEISLVVKK